MSTDISEDKFEFVEKALELADRHYDEFHDLSSEYMSELLMDDGFSTYKMFESLASDYKDASSEVRKGIDLACSALTGWTLLAIAETLVNKFNGDGGYDFKTDSEWVEFLSDKLGLCPNEKDTLLHDLNNLRGGEWVPTLNDAGVNPAIVAAFKKYIEEE